MNGHRYGDAIGRTCHDRSPVALAVASRTCLAWLTSEIVSVVVRHAMQLGLPHGLGPHRYTHHTYPLFLVCAVLSSYRYAAPTPVHHSPLQSTAVHRGVCSSEYIRMVFWPHPGSI